MMNHRLSDTERTLLSGYLDGEISSAERQTAEGLLARSKDAEAYLNDLRSLRNVAHEAFPPVLGAGIAGAAFSAKLTGSSIAAAAGKTTAVHGLFAGSWGMAGIATAAASIGVVMALNFGGGRIDNSGSNVRPAVAARTPSALPVAAAADTGSLVVPSMTPDELVGFAVKGTLPIDPNRNRYLTVQTEGNDSFRLELHRGKPKELARQFHEVNLAETPQLDTVEQAIRHSVKAFPNGFIGLRNDIWNNRQRLVSLLRERSLRPEINTRLAEEHRRLAEFRAARATQVAQFQQQTQAMQANVVQQGWHRVIGNAMPPRRVIPSATSVSQQAWNSWELRTFPVIIQPEAFPEESETVALTMACRNDPVVLQSNKVVVDLFDSPEFQELQGLLPAEMLAIPQHSEIAAGIPIPEPAAAAPVRIARPRVQANEARGMKNGMDILLNDTGSSVHVVKANPNTRQVVIIRTQEILEHARQQLQQADSLLRQLREGQKPQQQQPENSAEQP